MGVVIVSILGLLAASMSRPGAAPAGSRPPSGFAMLEGGGVVELVPLYVVEPHATRSSCINSATPCPPGMTCKRVTYPNGSVYYVCAGSGGTGSAGPNTNTITRPPKPPGIVPKGDVAGSCCAGCAASIKALE